MSWQLFYKEKEAVNGPTDRIYVFLKHMLSKSLKSIESYFLAINVLKYQNTKKC